MQKTPKEALEFIENNISNGRQFFEEEFEILEEAVNRLETMETIAKFKPEVLKRFKIELQPMKRKQNIHYSNHVIEYLNQNISFWSHWKRLPITITDNTTGKQLTISDCSNWRDQLYEWLGVPKEVLEVI